MSYADWRDRFLEAIDEGLYPAAWLDHRVRDGKAVFWGTERGAILAELRQYPSGAIEVHGLVAAGELDAIKSLIPLAELWGKANGAVRSSISSHPAWSRIMKDAGYAPSQLTIVKDL